MKRVYLGEFEELVLLSVAMLHENAYSVQITHTINEQADRDVRINQVHASLQRLEKKGMVVSRMGEPTAERGGRRKRLFSITSYGHQVILNIQHLRNTFWNLMPDHLKLSFK